MTDPDEYYPVNTIPAIAWALDLYFKAGGAFKEGGIVELVFPAAVEEEALSQSSLYV
jgi:hypothetical protein